ncbi:hypothetical protein MHC_05825 [Mycoplasma haemocanis str. Illinois]|uniref:Uncharacterized protein n=1 Tax=Mycoplasma haemocanis (strain Illinois) TaxID=1111676 RepID=H6N8P6_MYCHN|nr:hypothetical protein [Mycoplasma haemocanis]AEW46018.1 hypothetical protein MHC_05825 [Mycoplasma haemocanis str. Illinois]
MTLSSDCRIESIKKELEKDFFNIKFSKIKKHPLFQSLNLSDQEIIKNRVEINEALKNYLNCGDSKKFCLTLDPHFTLKRNVDNQLIITKYKCTKWKDHENISPDQINKTIDRLLNSDFFKFKYEEAKSSMETFLQTEALRDVVKNIGNHEYSMGSKWASFEDKDSYRKYWILLSYRAILLGERVVVVKSSELKHICSQVFKLYEREEEFINKYQNFLDSENLIITDFGLEDEMNKFNYYLDYFPDLLIKRNSNHKRTYITSQVDWKEMKKHILNKKHETIDKLKFERLEEVLKVIFSNAT